MTQPWVLTRAPFMHLAVHVFMRPAGNRYTDFVVTVRARLPTSLLVLVLLGTDVAAAVCTLACASASTRSEGSSSRDAAHCESATVDSEATALVAVAGDCDEHAVRAMFIPGSSIVRAVDGSIVTEPSTSVLPLARAGRVGRPTPGPVNGSAPPGAPLPLRI